MDSIIQFITVLVIFIFVLAITYFTTVWIGNYQKTRNRGVNIELLDAQRLNQSQYIQIVRIGEKFLALGISKDSVTPICEIPEDELRGLDGETGSEDSGKGGGSVRGAMPDFRKILEAAGKGLPGGKKD